MTPEDYQQQLEEQQQYEELLKNDPEYVKWLDELNRQQMNGWKNTNDSTTPDTGKTQEKAA